MIRHLTFLAWSGFYIISSSECSRYSFHDYQRWNLHNPDHDLNCFRSDARNWLKSQCWWLSKCTVDLRGRHRCMFPARKSEHWENDDRMIHTYTSCWYCWSHRCWRGCDSFVKMNQRSIEISKIQCSHQLSLAKHVKDKPLWWHCMQIRWVQLSQRCMQRQWWLSPWSSLSCLLSSLGQLRLAN